MNDVLISLTCGGFLFIATVTMLAPLLQSSSSETDGAADGKAEGKSRSPLSQLLLEVFSFGLGVALMVGVVFLEHDD